MLATLERGRTMRDVSLARVALWGAVGAERRRLAAFDMEHAALAERVR